ncbi:MAG: hypothetical protein FJ280_07095 [Planctomycetes bacterium]|nr:hypothetical protein [Planctomycetota bacterium]
MKRPQRQLVLNKGAEKYIFRYEQGREDELLDALIDQAKDRRTDFDWFDAAVISFKLTQSLIGSAEQLLREGDPRREESRWGSQDKDVKTIP